MINQVATTQRSFYDFYKQLHFSDKWDSKQVEAAISQTKKMLDDQQRSETKITNA
jgi:hypothetical protein